jgi:sugar phosphate isomerase/epimerase
VKIPGQANAHLTYCLNVHPVTTLEDLRRTVESRAVSIFRQVGAERGIDPPYGLGMWLPRTVADGLSEDEACVAFRDWLGERGFYVFTLNGFPYGRFHGARVKQDVYRPDWSDLRRLDYTRELADILARLLPEGVDGTISTLPVTYGEWVNEMTLAAAGRNLAAALEHLARQTEETGRRIVLALEPEPDCYLDEADGVIEFFRRLVPAEVLPHVDSALRETARSLLGVCLDTVHSAVLFEDPADVLSRYRVAGIPVAKMHLGAAIAAEWEGAPPAALAEFRDEVYLHQVRADLPPGPAAYQDLPDALDEGASGERRVHYHVPLAWEGTGELRGAAHVTPRLMREALEAGVRHFETEVYTLSVMPGARDDAVRQDEILAGELVHCLDLFGRV